MRLACLWLQQQSGMQAWSVATGRECACRVRISGAFVKRSSRVTQFPGSLLTRRLLQGAVLESSDRGGIRIQYSKNPYGKKRDVTGNYISTPIPSFQEEAAAAAAAAAAAPQDPSAPGVEPKTGMQAWPAVALGRTSSRGQTYCPREDQPLILLVCCRVSTESLPGCAEIQVLSSLPCLLAPV